MVVKNEFYPIISKQLPKTSEKRKRINFLPKKVMIAYNLNLI